MAQYDIPTFEGRPDEDVHEWLAAARAEFERHGVLHAQWAPIAKKFLRRGFVLEELRNNTKLQEAIVNEEWDSFTHALLYGQEDTNVTSASSQTDEASKETEGLGPENEDRDDPRGALTRFREDHPIAATAAAVGLAVAAPLAAPVALVGAINLVGFGAGGVVAGSIAAGIQSAFYGGAVASGSLFAVCQSIGAGGAALATVGPAVSAGAGALGLFGASRIAPRRGPPLSPNAPSLDPEHLYHSLRTLGSGNYESGLDPSQCAECTADRLVRAEQQSRFPDTLIVPTTDIWRGRHFDNGPDHLIFVDFRPAHTQHAPGYNIGVSLADLLEFRAEHIVQPQYKLLRHGDGPLLVEFVIARLVRIPGPQRKQLQELLRFDNIVFANCRHRKITRFQLGFTLAYNFRFIIEKHLPEYNWRDFQLSKLSWDGVNWRVLATI